MGERIGTVVPTHGDHLICAGDSGIYRFNPPTAKKQTWLIPKQRKDQTTVSMMANVIPVVVSG